MDHHAMRAAMNRALGLPEPTEIIGIPPQIKIRWSGFDYYHDLAQRLMDQANVLQDPLCREAAEAIRTLAAQPPTTHA